MIRLDNNEILPNTNGELLDGKYRPIDSFDLANRKMDMDTREPFRRYTEAVATTVDRNMETLAQTKEHVGEEERLATEREEASKKTSQKDIEL